MIEEKIGFKVVKKQPFCPVFAVFSLPLSLHRSNHQPEPQPVSPPQVASPTTRRPLPCLKQPSFLPPTVDFGHRHLSRRLLSHRPNHPITTETPTLGNFLLPALRSLHVEFISACSGRIINQAFDWANFGPAQVAAAGSGPVPFL